MPQQSRRKEDSRRPAKVVFVKVRKCQPQGVLGEQSEWREWQRAGLSGSNLELGNGTGP